MILVIRTKSYDPIVSTGLMSDVGRYHELCQCFTVGMQSHHTLVLDHCLLMMEASPMGDRREKKNW
jgi:hypothetical protein